MNDARRAYGLAPAAEIVPKLFVGSVVDGMDLAFLKARNIGLVVNCTKEAETVPEGVAYFQVPVDDDLTAAQDRVMHRYLPRAVDVVLANAHGGVLLHCFAGQQRSAAVACACLMAATGCSCDEAIAHVRGRKPDALRPRVNFERALRDYENSVNISSGFST